MEHTIVKKILLNDQGVKRNNIVADTGKVSLFGNENENYSHESQKNNASTTEPFTWKT